MKTRFDTILETVSFILEADKKGKKKKPASEPRPARKPAHPLMAGLDAAFERRVKENIAKGMDTTSARSEASGHFTRGT